MLQEYDFLIKYGQGVENINPHYLALSRCSLSTMSMEIESERKSQYNGKAVATTGVLGVWTHTASSCI